jgi:hypothetical protein
MSFARFLAALFASFLLALGLIALLPALHIARPDAEIAWTASLYADKERAAGLIPGPRIIAVGGSGTLFSFDSEVATRRIGRPVLNFGTHAGLGLPYILDRAGRLLRAGDVVLLAPEYELLQSGAPPNEHTIQFVTFYDRGYLKQRPLTEWPRYIFGYSVLPSLVEGMKQMLNGPPAGRPDVVLDRLGNARGNTVALSGGEQLAGATPQLPPPPVSEAALEALRKFAALAAARHAKILVIPPALVRTRGYSDPEFRKFQSSLDILYAGLGMKVLGTPEQAFLPPQDMYDSIYHANDRGRARYTSRILPLVCQALGCRT